MFVGKNVRLKTKIVEGLTMINLAVVRAKL